MQLCEMANNVSYSISDELRVKNWFFKSKWPSYASTSELVGSRGLNTFSRKIDIFYILYSIINRKLYWLNFICELLIKLSYEKGKISSKSTKNIQERCFWDFCLQICPNRNFSHIFNCKHKTDNIFNILCQYHPKKLYTWRVYIENIPQK